MTRSDDCANVSDILPEFLAGRVSAEDDARVRAHLEECGECRNRANAVSLLQQTPVPVPDPERWNDFVDGVVDAAGHRRRIAARRGPLVAAAALILIVGGVFFWDRLVDPGTPDDGLEQLARDVAELSEEEAAAWTAGLGPIGWAAAGFDTTGLTEEEVQQLVTEVDRT